MSEDEKILSLCPGPEMDKRLAEEFMGGMLKNYSKDMGDAWKIVEKLEEQDWRVDIINSKKKKVVLGMKMVEGAPCTLNVRFGCPVEFDSIPEGICKVALLTILVEKTGW